MPLSFKNIYKQLKDIVMGQNVRLEAHYDIETLQADIEEHGLQTPVTVFELAGGQAEVIRGHRRTTALLAIATANPKLFKKLFPKGIPVQVISGITYEKAQTMKIDDSNYKSLSDPFEVQMCANILFGHEDEKGKQLTEKAVVLKMSGILDRIHPPKPAKRKEMDAIKAKITVAKAQGLTKEAETLQAEFEKLIFDGRRGKIQNLNAAFRCPDLVMSALRYKAIGTLEAEWDEKVYLPSNLNYDQVKQLFKAFTIDLELDREKGGTLKYNKRTPGPNFIAKWNELCKKFQKAEADKEAGTTLTREKAQSATIMKEHSFMSTGFSQLTQKHCGKDISMETLLGYDEIAYYAELLAERAPKEWTDCVELAKGLEVEIQAEREEVAAK